MTLNDILDANNETGSMPDQSEESGPLWIINIPRRWRYHSAPVRVMDESDIQIVMDQTGRSHGEATETTRMYGNIVDAILHLIDPDTPVAI